jgi:hypothetical protein
MMIISALVNNASDEASRKYKDNFKRTKRDGI